MRTISVVPSFVLNLPDFFLCSYYISAYLSPYFLGFLPLEPSMGGIEECEGSSCHGALIKMAASEVIHVRLSNLTF